MDYNDHKLRNKPNELHFWHRARKNLIKNLLFSVYKNSLPQRRILDIGCGTGTNLEEIKKFGRVIALDNNNNAVKITGQKGYEIILADIEDYILENSRYDAVCCFDILEHLKDDRKIINNIFSSLKQGGYFFFTVPAWPIFFGPHDIALGHIRRYGKKDILDKLKNAGFQIENFGFWNSFLFFLIFFFRLTRKLRFKLFPKSRYKSEAKPLNKYLNGFLFFILNLENKLALKNKSLPFGLTIYGIAKK